MDLTFRSAMKQLLLCIAILGFALHGQAQSEFSSKFKAIPPVKFPIAPKKAPEPKKVAPPNSDIPTIKAPNVFKSPDAQFTKPAPAKTYQLGQSNTFSMVPKNEFEHKPGDYYMEKMTKDIDKTLLKEGLKEDTRYLVINDVNFEMIRTKSKYFVIKFRDFGIIDGDLINAYFNDGTVLRSVKLENEFKEFKIYLNEGLNKLILEAQNRGALGGNTGEFHIYDAEGKLIRTDYWENWDAGIKGTFNIFKE